MRVLLNRLAAVFGRVPLYMPPSIAERENFKPDRKVPHPLRMQAELKNRKCRCTCSRAIEGARIVFCKRHRAYVQVSGGVFVTDRHRRKVSAVA